VVQTGVKFFGCENKIAQPSPIHSWKLIGPSVVSAEKLGVSSFMRKLIFGAKIMGFVIVRKLIFDPRAESLIHAWSPSAIPHTFQVACEVTPPLNCGT
jgi:hypothetical protein